MSCTRNVCLFFFHLVLLGQPLGRNWGDGRKQEESGVIYGEESVLTWELMTLNIWYMCSRLVSTSVDTNIYLYKKNLWFDLMLLSASQRLDLEQYKNYMLLNYAPDVVLEQKEKIIFMYLFDNIEQLLIGKSFENNVI